MSHVMGESEDLVCAEEDHLVRAATRHAQRIRWIAADGVGSKCLLEHEAEHLASLAYGAGRQTGAQEVIDEGLAVPVGDRGDRPIAEDRQDVDPEGRFVAHQRLRLQVEPAQPFCGPVAERSPREALIEKLATQAVGLDR